MALPSASSTHHTGYKGTVSIAAVTTNSYGEAQTAVTAIVYTKCENIMLPAPKYGSVNIPHLSGLTVVPEGVTDFGQVTFKLPEDGGDFFAAGVSTPGTPLEYTIVIVVPALSKTWTGRGHFVDEGGAPIQRGSPFSRNCAAAMHELMTVS